jgi:hypothetical protein
MSDDAPDAEALAKRFLDLWQDQVAASVADPAMAEWLARFLAAPGGPGVTPTMGVSQGVSQNDKAGFAGHPGGFADIFAAMASGAAPAAASPGPGDDRLDELSRRLVECERRLAALESGAGRAGGKPRRRPRKPGP